MGRAVQRLRLHARRLPGPHRRPAALRRRRAFLHSRGIELPDGLPTDPPGGHTICAMGNRKNVVFNEVLDSEGIAPYPGSMAVMDLLDAAGVPQAIVSSSKNARRVLEAAGLGDRFGVVVDGIMAAAEGLAGKPAPGHVPPGGRVARRRTRPVDRRRGRRHGHRRRQGRRLRLRARHRPRRQRRGTRRPRRGCDRHRPRRHDRTSATRRSLRLTRSRDMTGAASVPTSLDTVRFPVDPWRLVECEYHAGRPRGDRDRCSRSGTATSGCAPTPPRAARHTATARTSTASTRRGTSSTPRTRSRSPRPVRRSSTSPTPS